MASFLPVLGFILALLGFQKNPSLRFSSFRHNFLYASVLWGILVVAATETSNFFGTVSFPFISAFWLLVCLSGGIYWIKDKKQISIDLTVPLKNLSTVDRIILAGITFIFLVTGTIAIIAPPNTLDSMSYHMSRVAHWAQNQSVNHYPTSIERQLHQSPWAEFAILQFQILSGSDRMANLIQWFAALGSILGVSLIAGYFCEGRKAQLAAAAIAATIPVGILEATSTQNDYVVTFWLVCFICFLLQLIKSPDKIDALFLASALGLAVLTKPTAIFYALPFLIWLVIAILKKSRTLSGKTFLYLASAVTLINAGHWLRNYLLYHHILGPESYRTMLTNKSFAPSYAIANLFKSAFMHWQTPFAKLNVFIEEKIYQLADLLHLDLESTGPFSFTINDLAFHEDYATNLLHAFLVIVGILIALCSKKIRTWQPLMTYAICLLCGIGLFSVMFVWYPWNGRLQLPFFVLMAPFLAVSLSVVIKEKTLFALLMFLLLASLPWLLLNTSRPILGADISIFQTPREELYMANRPLLKNDYLEGAGYLKKINCNHLALTTSADSWEYPLWGLGQKTFGNPFRITHVNVRNPSAQIKSAVAKNNTPCALVDLGLQLHNKNKTVVDNTPFILTRAYGYLSVYVPEHAGLAGANLHYHLIKRAQYAAEAKSFLKGNDNQKLNTEKNAKLIELRRKEMFEAILIDPEELDALLPGLGAYFRDYLLTGLRTRYVGLLRGEEDRTLAGEKLIEDWDRWVKKNDAAIRQALAMLPKPQ